MNKPTYVTNPLLRDEPVPERPVGCRDTAADSILAGSQTQDWHDVKLVAHAIDTERAMRDEQRRKLAELAAKRKRGAWSTLLQVLGVRRTQP